jgi:peroxiredoxin
MKTLRILLVVILAAPVLLAAESPGEIIGRQVTDFKLNDFDGKTHSLSEFQDKQLVILAFLGTECPLAKLYAPQLEQLATNYGERGVAVIGINSNSQDSIEEIAAFTSKHKLRFPMLKDPRNRVADQVGAKRTPEVFVLDSQRRVRYHGRIDDQYGVGYIRDEPTRRDLKVALDELLAGKAVSQPQTDVVGCYIGRIAEPKEDADVTYSNQIARILQKHCIECHREGEIGPFALTEYSEVKSWRETIEEVIRDQRMPPWHANPEHGRFANERRMPEKEKQLVYQWVANGAPEGDRSQLPEPTKFVTGWQLPSEPDQLVPMRNRPFKVPAEGVVEYQYFVVDPGFKEDKWIKAAEIIPGNRSVVHHAIVFFNQPESSDDLRGVGFLTGYVPGQKPFSFSDGLARRIPAGSKFVFQMHYTPVGSVQQDITKVGLVFADPNEVKEEAISLAAITHDFEIPPNTSNYRVDLKIPFFPEPSARLLAITPHMHVRGKSFRFSIVDKHDDEQILLDVPQYDFNWQHAYELAEPVELRREQIRAHCVFDNSSGNRVNPNPGIKVRWGDQTWEEMALGFMEVAVPLDWRERQDRTNNESTELKKARARKAARAFIDRFDKNHDDVVTPGETPATFSIFAFRGMDKDRDGGITFDEAYQETIKARGGNGR